jgi:hypothetical protein
VCVKNQYADPISEQMNKNPTLILVPSHAKPITDGLESPRAAVVATAVHGGGGWKPVPGASEFGTNPNRFNRATFGPVETTALRIEVQLQPTWSGGVLEWRVTE